MRRVLALVLLVAAAASVPFVVVLGRGGEAGDTAARVDDVAWLVGHWAGTTARGQHVEEMWMPARDGHIAGVFRWERGNGRWLFELLTVDERPAGPATDDPIPLTMRIKHFDRQLRGQEEKTESTTLQLVEHTASRATFEMKDGARVVRVGYQRRGPDALLATFDETEPGKPPVHIEFPYTRVR